MRKSVAVTVLLFLSIAQALAQSALAPTTNSSAVIATGNTFQTVLASVSGTSRKSLTIQNNNATDSCWITFGTVSGVVITAGNATKAASILLLAGGSFARYYPYVPSDAIQATCTTTNDTLYVDTQ